MLGLSYLSPVPPMARILGLLGLLPFAVSAIGIWLPVLGDLRFGLPLLALGYGVLIASFLGGVRWGAAMQNNIAASQPLHLVMSVVPSLTGLVALMLPLQYAFSLLIVVFVAQAVLDNLAADNGDVVAWYKPLRLVLTAGVVASLTSLLVHTLTH